MRWFAAAVVFYGVMATVTFGALNANDQYFCHHVVASICDASMVRYDQGRAFVMSLFPPTWLAAVVVTGLYADGISFTATPARVDR